MQLRIENNLVKERKIFQFQEFANRRWADKTEANGIADCGRTIFDCRELNDSKRIDVPRLREFGESEDPIDARTPVG